MIPENIQNQANESWFSAVY